MNFKQIAIAAALLFVAGVSQGQSIIEQRGVSIPRLYHQNYFFLNPAFAGAEGRREFGINGHLNALPGGTTSTAPLAFIAYYHGHVGDTTRNGIGVHMLYDQFDQFWLGQLGLTYTKRFKFGNRSSLAIGTRLSAKYMNVDLSEMPHPEDELGLVGHDSDLRPDVDVGLWLNVRNFYAGATFASLLEPNFNLLENAERENPRELFLTAGYRFEITSQASITPSVFYDKPFKDGKSKLQYGAQANFGFLTAGAIYRGQFDDVSVWNLNAGVNISNNFQLLGAFDLNKQVNGERPDSQIEASMRVRF
ncbi:PorP/SprF family type IX secretion system membrane protein [Rufibacter sp. LB8]|uniref:PorP/SprF family type IX secretion system membrane protein n=1 Tax=Rufibacter sp. LB8 TaxID=2777781 RepID=UPI00178C7FAE|nr:PorP/SprF family type IX secretion system membrane protein [Rufibacter sp. LB8]